MTKRSLRQGNSGPLVRRSFSSDSSQLLSQYYIDPVAGSDDFLGTEDAPLQTLSEFARRLMGLDIEQSVSALLLSDALADDRMVLSAALVAEAELTISGQPTDVASFTIVSAASAAPTSSADYVWDIETSGIDWTAQTARRIELPTGEVGWVMLVVDADNVRVSAFITRANTSIADVTPAAGPATLQTLPIAPSPVLDVASGQIGRHDASQSVIRFGLTDIAFTQDEDDTLQLAGMCRFYGCDIKTVGVTLDGIVRVESSRLNIENLNGAGISSMRINGAGDYQLVGSLVTTSRSAGPAPFHILQTKGTIQNCSFFRVCCTITNGGSCSFVGDGCYFEDAYAFAAMSIENGASAAASSGTDLEGSVDGAPFAIVATNGGRLFYITTPTISGGGTGDTQVGGSTVAYGSLPSVATSTAAITTNS